MCQPCAARFRPTARPDVTDEMLIESYESCLSTTKVGERFGMNGGSVRERLIAIGYSLRPPGTGALRRDVDTATLVEEYAAGASSTELSARYRLSTNSIIARIRKSGGEIRKKGGRWVGPPVERTADGKWLLYCHVCGGKRILYHNPPSKDRDLPCPRCSAERRFGPATANRERQRAARRFMQTDEYKAWRAEVFERDEHECQLCFSKWPLQAHHIKMRRFHPDLALDVGNGITLCRDCHLQKVFRHERDYEKKFEAILDNRACGVL